ncbi:MAG: repeat-containing protein [Verrucomicrobiales bacterium]|nr:repeat-containing protein [Verrucomicrobiales bacterium]
MSNLLVGLLGALVATNQPAAVSNLVKQTTGISIEVVNPNDPIDVAYHKVLTEDDDARAEVDKWIKEGNAFAEQGAGAPTVTLNARIEQRFAEVKKAYENFLLKNPSHARARLAYGCFLNELGEDYEGSLQMEKARELDPSNPAAWNNLANYYGHRSPVKKSFEYYAKAIELNPKETTYYWNFATTVYLFRKDAMEFYKIDEQQVFDKALDLYRQALKLDPTNFVLATDYSGSFYGTKPPRYEEGLVAWQNTLKIARDDIEREGVYVHLARIEINLGRMDDARKHLDVITNQMYLNLKSSLSKKLEKQKSK